MARYTLNLSEVCETMTGQKYEDQVGNPFDRIDDIATAAIPYLFSDRYTLFDDDDDREELEKMIIEHYWEYEICTYTPSDFILRLNRKLREIAPFYNKRYETIKQQYPIFDDVNYSAVDTKNDVYSESNTGASIRNESGSGTDNEMRNGTDTNVKQRGGANIDIKKREGVVTSAAVDTGTDTFNKGAWTSDENLKKSESTSTTGSRTGELERRNVTAATANDTPQNMSLIASPATADQFLSNYAINTQYHDGDLVGFENSPNNVYTSDGFSVSQGTDAQGRPTYNVTPNGSYGGTLGDCLGDKVTYNSTVDSESGEDYESGKTLTGGSDSTNYGKTTTTTTEYSPSGKTAYTETDRHELNDTETNTTAYGTSFATAHTKDYKTTDTDNRNKNAVTTGNDIKNVKGKQNATRTYAEMMNSYRKSLINIYEEIIEEVKELFFIIY